ncbi:MAG: hypothetical protein Tsb009_39420 [Planctomycetaceae bacterium]
MSSDQHESEESLLKLRAQSRKLFAEAQEFLAAAQYKKAQRHLEQIPKNLRNADHHRMLEQIQNRIQEVQTLAAKVRAAVEADELETPGLLENVRRLMELKPGDDWVNDIRHQLETREHHLQYPDNSPPLLESSELVPIESPNDSQPENLSAQTLSRPSPPPLPEPYEIEENFEDDVESDLPLAAKVLLWIVLVLFIVAISIALAVVLVKGSTTFIALDYPRFFPFKSMIPHH